MDEICADYVTSDGVRCVLGLKRTGAIPDKWLHAYPNGRLGRADSVIICYAHGSVTPDTVIRRSAEFLAFCAGVMPPYVFSDWLEENVPDIPPQVLELLRLPYNPRPSYTSGRNISGEELAPSPVSG